VKGIFEIWARVIFWRKEAREQRRSDLKLRIIQALNPEGCSQTLVESPERVYELLKEGTADLLLTVSGPDGTRYYAVRFHDATLAKESREDCLDLYGLRETLH
jgi:hypothetical protein